MCSSELISFFKYSNFASSSIGEKWFVEIGHFTSKYDLLQQSQVIILSGLPPTNGMSLHKKFLISSGIDVMSLYSVKNDSAASFSIAWP